MKIREVDSRCRRCFQVNPDMSDDCDASPTGRHVIEVLRFAGDGWDESKHPRHKKGSALGGEFAPKGEGEYDSPTKGIKLARGGHMTAEVARLAMGQLRGWKDLGKYKPEDFELRTVELDKVTPSQTGEDYINDSSKELAKHIGTFGSSGRIEDYRPILVDKNYRIIDGNHRHAARKLAGIKYIPVIRAKKHDDTK